MAITQYCNIATITHKEPYITLTHKEPDITLKGDLLTLLLRSGMPKEPYIAYKRAINQLEKRPTHAFAALRAAAPSHHPRVLAHHALSQRGSLMIEEARAMLRVFRFKV